MWKLTLLLMFTVLLFGCSRAASVTNSTSNQQASQEAEEYRVYSNLINTLHVQDKSKAVAIVDETMVGSVSADNDPDKVIRFLRERMPQSVAPGLIDDFRAKNNQPHKLARHFNLSVEYVLLSREELNNIFRQGDGWPEFSRRYSAGQLINFSRIAFNREMNEALVYTSSTSGPRSGAGYYVLLIKDGGAWTIKHKLDAWVS